MLSRTDFWAASIVSSSFPLDSPNSGLSIACSRAAVQALSLASYSWRQTSNGSGVLAGFLGLRHRLSSPSSSVRPSLGAVRRRSRRGAGAVQIEEPVDRLAIGVEHRRRGVEPDVAGIGDRVDPPGGTGRPGLPGRLEEAVLLHLAERPVQRAHGDPEQAESPQVVLDHVAVRALHRHGQQDERREEVARRPAGQRLALVERLPAADRHRPTWLVGVRSSVHRLASTFSAAPRSVVAA